MITELSEIKVLRKRFGLTQQQLAQASGVSQSLIAKVEAGQLDPTYTNARKIFSALETLSQKRALKAKDVMNPSLLLLSPENTLKDAIAKMKKHGISQLPVVDKQPMGVVSESILLDAITAGKSPSLAVKEIMADTPPTVSPDAQMEVISNLLKYFSIILVSERGKLKGVITKADVLTKGFH